MRDRPPAGGGEAAQPPEEATEAALCEEEGAAIVVRRVAAGWDEREWPAQGLGARQALLSPRASCQCPTTIVQPVSFYFTFAALSAN